MTTNWRITIAIPSELEKRIVELRKTEKYCRMSYSEIVRRMLELGLNAQNEDKK